MKTLNTIVSSIAQKLSLSNVPRVVISTVREMGNSDGEYSSFGHVIYIRRRPVGGSFNFSP